MWRFQKHFSPKCQILACFYGIQDKMHDGNRGGLLKLEKKLLVRIGQEEMMWLQKAKDKQMTLGEGNIAYFHVIARQKGFQKYIIGFKYRDKLWCQEENELLCIVVQFYKALYME